MLNIALIAAVFILAGVLLSSRIKRLPFLPSKKEEIHQAYERRASLLVSTERSFLDTLEGALDDRYRIYVKIRLADILQVPETTPPRERRKAEEAVNRQCVDFLVCERESMSILGAVMLDADDEEPTEERRRLEFQLETALSLAGIPLIRFPARSSYDPSEVRIETSRSLYLKWKMSAENGDGDALSDPQAAAEPHSAPPAGTASGKCPSCSAPMLVRRARKGKYAGRYIMTCSNYPDCKEMRLVKENFSPLQAPA